MKHINTLLKAVELGLKHEKGFYLGNRVGFSNNLARVSNVHFEFSTESDLVNFTSNDEYITIDSSEFLSVAPILKTSHTFFETSKRTFLINTDEGRSKSVSLSKVNRNEILNINIHDHPKKCVLSVEILNAIKLMTRYNGDIVITNNNELHLKSNLIAIKVDFDNSAESQFIIPSDVSKIITEEITGPLTLYSDGEMVGIFGHTPMIFIKYNNSSSEVHQSCFNSEVSYCTSVDRKSVIYSLMSLNNTKRFNNRVLLSRTAPSTDLCINFRKNEVEFINLNTNVKKVIRTKCSVAATVMTYGSLLAKVLRDIEGGTISFSLKNTRGLVIDTSHVIASTNANL